MDMDDVCRTCLRTSIKLLPLLADSILPHKIKTISSIEVSIDDKLPSKICAECIANINLFYNFRKVIINNDIELKDRYIFIKPDNIIDDENMEPVFVANDDENYYQSEELPIKPNMETKNELSIAIVNAQVSQREAYTNVIKKRKDKLSLKNKLHKCNKCDFESIEWNKYRMHLQNHNVKMCPVCGKFISTINLSRHITTHTDPPVTCKQCGKVSKNMGSLRGHMLIHKGINRACKICGETFTEKAAYNTHLNSHKSKEEKSAVCPLCNKHLYGKQGLKKYIRSHTGERPYLCELCKKGFSSSYALKTHRRLHTNERPFKCALCSMTFAHKVSLCTHLKSKHQMGTIDNSLKSA